MQKMKVEVFEKGFLFGFVRWASLFLGALGVIAVVFGGIMFFDAWATRKNAKTVKVKPSEVKELVDKQKKEKQMANAQADPEQPGDQRQQPAEPTKTPEEQKVDALAMEIANLITDGMMPGADQQDRDSQAKEIRQILILKAYQMYDIETEHKLVIRWLNGLKDSVMASAENSDRGMYADGYIDLFAEKSQKEQSKVIEKRAEAQMQMLMTGYAISVGLLLAFLSGLVLIMAAIERNTRVNIKDKEEQIS